MRRTFLLLALLVLIVPIGAPPASATASGSRVRIEGGSNFGSQAVGSTGSKTVTVTNTGTDAVYIGTVSVTSVDGAFFLDFESNSCGGYLDPGASCSYDVLFTPPSPGTKAGYTTIGIDNESKVIKLRGRGT